MEINTKIELITEGWELVAIFDGWYKADLPRNGKIVWLHPDKCARLSSTLQIPSSSTRFKKYTESWDWLIPVCYKWDSLNFSDWDSNRKKRYMELCDQLDHCVSCYEIIPTFDQLVKNLKWYNEIQSRGGGN